METSKTPPKEPSCGNESKENWLASPMDHPLGVGIVSKSLDEKSGCDHRLKLDKLIDRLINEQTKNNSNCPVCQEPILLIQDGMASKGDPSVFFKYGKYFFSLAIEDSRKWYRKESLAQERIARVFAIRKSTLKILSKGKILYPDSSRSQIEISNELVRQSTMDILPRRKKPTLVVMGTPIHKELRQPRAGLFETILGMAYGIIYALYLWIHSMVVPLLPGGGGDENDVPRHHA